MHSCKKCAKYPWDRDAYPNDLPRSYCKGMEDFGRERQWTQEGRDAENTLGCFTPMEKANVA